MQSTEVTPTFTASGEVWLWSATLLLETGMPEWPWFSRCWCVHWCKNSYLKSWLLKRPPRTVFYHVERLCSWVQQESLPILKRHHLISLEQGILHLWVVREWWQWQIIAHFPWLWLILRVKVFLCCSNLPDIHPKFSGREGQTLIFFLLWLLKWRYWGFPSRNGFSWM